MEEYRLGEVESKFAEIIWTNEPLSSRRLAELALEKLNWKRTTTYTVLKRLCERGLFQNQGGTVSALVTQEEFMAHRSEQFLDEAFQGSLPAFMAAFSSRKRLSEVEIKELEQIIDGMRE